MNTSAWLRHTDVPHAIDAFGAGEFGYVPNARLSNGSGMAWFGVAGKRTAGAAPQHLIADVDRLHLTGRFQSLQRDLGHYRRFGQSWPKNPPAMDSLNRVRAIRAFGDRKSVV